jgi:hypothetical protein
MFALGYFKGFTTPSQCHWCVGRSLPWTSRLHEKERVQIESRRDG